MQVSRTSCSTIGCCNRRAVVGCCQLRRSSTRSCSLGFRHGNSSSSSFVCQAKKSDEEVGPLAGFVGTATGLVETVSDLVPETVPRPAAKAGVAIVGGLLLFTLLKQVLSGVFTLVVLGGLAYVFLIKGTGKDDSIDVSSSSKRVKDDDNDDDPLSQARNIMNKYK